MSPQFWVGVIIIVLLLELLRIGISAAVLIHVLTSGVFRRPDEVVGGEESRREPHTVRARREAALPPTMAAVRGAMDEIAASRSGAAVQQAIDALDEYTRLQVEATR